MEAGSFAGFVRNAKKEDVLMRSVESFCKRAIEMGVEEAKVIDPGSVVTANPPLSGSCNHGLEARPSMEACGIDVFKTARDNGFPVEVLRTRDEGRNMFGLVLVEREGWGRLISSK
jgi:predicted metal-binding protein